MGILETYALVLGHKFRELFFVIGIICRFNKLIKENNLGLSFLDLREELNADQFSILKDLSTHRLYQLPSKTTPRLKKSHNVPAKQGA